MFSLAEVCLEVFSLDDLVAEEAVETDLGSSLATLDDFDLTGAIAVSKNLLAEEEEGRREGVEVEGEETGLGKETEGVEDSGAEEGEDEEVVDSVLEEEAEETVVGEPVEEESVEEGLCVIFSVSSKFTTAGSCAATTVKISGQTFL